MRVAVTRRHPAFRNLGAGEAPGGHFHFEEEEQPMMTAMVLICSLIKTPEAGSCGIENAVDVLRVPGEYHSLVTCFARAQAFLAASRYELATDLYPKIVCGRPHLPANYG